MTEGWARAVLRRFGQFADQFADCFGRRRPYPLPADNPLTIGSGSGLRPVAGGRECPVRRTLGGPQLPQVAPENPLKIPWGSLPVWVRFPPPAPAFAHLPACLFPQVSFGWASPVAREGCAPKRREESRTPDRCAGGRPTPAQSTASRFAPARTCQAAASGLEGSTVSRTSAVSVLPSANQPIPSLTMSRRIT